jgi:hypothetical protein
MEFINNSNTKEMEIRKAHRKQAKIKLALQAPSGGGKTYSALLLASGMLNVKTGQLTLGGQFDAYKRGQLERNIQLNQYYNDIENNENFDRIDNCRLGIITGNEIFRLLRKVT